MQDRKHILHFFIGRRIEITLYIFFICAILRKDRMYVRILGGMYDI